MSAYPSYLEIHIHGVDGYVAAFAQNDAETIRKLIEQMQPGRIFTQPYLAVAGHRSLTVFPSATVVRVDLLMRGFPDWPFHLHIHDMTEFTEEEFRVRVSDAAERRPRSSGQRAVYAEIEMTNGERIYLEMAVQVREEPITQVDFGVLLQQFLSASSLHARRLGGGAIVINPAHILRVQFHPAPPQPPLNAWSADPLAEAEPA